MDYPAPKLQLKDPSAVERAFTQYFSKNGFSPDSSPGVSIRNVIAAVGAYYQIPYKDLTGPRRYKDLVAARKMISYLATELTTASLPQIGRVLNRDHTTIIHGRDAIRRAIKENDPATITNLERLRDALQFYKENYIL